MGFGIGGPDFPAGCAVVFGACGGLGQSIAGLLAERGCKVVLSCRTAAKAEGLLRQIQQAGGSASISACDVTDEAAVERVVSGAVAAYGRVHTVISALGPIIGIGPVARSNTAEFRSVIDTDIHGFYNVAKAGVRALTTGGGGSLTALVAPAMKRIINNDGMSSVPKAAITLMIKHIAMEEAHNNIRANVVGPGVTNAGLVTGSLADGPGKDMIELAESLTPMQRRAAPNEIAEVVAFIASAKASYITGQVIMADGGLTT
jgi:NAD(P)-dependent dehydrogenase (short-subunit alcohol dehydrogenase family)